MANTAITIQIPENVAERVRTRVTREGTTIEAKAAELLTQYGDPRLTSDTEFDRQMVIAREELDRFRRTFQELSK